MEERIEQLRGQVSKGNAAELNMYSKQLGGPTSSSCFCNRSVYINYINDFYNWYDNEYKKK